jgi:hypothetical protein
MNENLKAHESVTAEAERLVSGDRGSSYGHPLDDFAKTAALWSIILGITVTEEQVAQCMAQVKVSRELNKHKRDNLVDECGYVKCLELVIDEKARRLAEGWTFNARTARWSPPQK